jgi:alpha-amylase/alpha-mannosidase (GH57 family)
MTQGYICVHGHFYQPPRENPWLEEVELQESAHPFHDWNERICAECYAPNTASRILDEDRRIIDIVNNYSRISFNFGPTLLSWLERHQPDIYQEILKADELSQELFSGHGSALAQIYNHMIMPLANEKDKRTQVIWGIQDFEHRFKRFPEGMWLPETAVDTNTLEILAEQGIAFTLLAPSQAEKIRLLGEEEWQNVRDGRIDPTRPYLCQLPSGNSITLFFYDGPISQDIAFGGLLQSGENLANRLSNAFSEERNWAQLVHVATDGETYGHHHHQGDMALAYGLYHIEQHDIARITIYGEYLEKHPPEWEVVLVEPSSWSCFHGVDRWCDDCGCNSGMHSGWNQAWRKPLREAMDHVRDTIRPLFEDKTKSFFQDSWQVRDQYIKLLLNRSHEHVATFLSSFATHKLSLEEQTEVLKLLEMERHCMLMYTSCGWFFDELSGIETTQIMRYAARAIQLAEELFDLSLEEDFTTKLEQAPSNIKKFKHGKNVYQEFVKPASLDFLFVGSHFALSSLFEEELENIRIYCYSVDSEIHEKYENGNLKLVIGRTRIISEITWDQSLTSFAAVYLGGHNANCGIREYMNNESFEDMRQDIVEVFSHGDIPELIRVMDKHFETHNYTLWHLFKDEQQKVIHEIIQVDVEEIETVFRQILDHQYTFINFLTELHAPMPRTLAVTAETIINTDICHALETDPLDLNTLEQLLNETKKWNISLHATEIGFKAGWRIVSLMEQLETEPGNTAILEQLGKCLELLQPFDLHLNLWKAQNILFSLARSHYPSIHDQADQGDPQANEWIDRFRELADHLHVYIAFQ